MIEGVIGGGIIRRPIPQIGTLTTEQLREFYEIPKIRQLENALSLHLPRMPLISVRGSSNYTEKGLCAYLISSRPVKRYQWEDIIVDQTEIQGQRFFNKLFCSVYSSVGYAVQHVRYNSGNNIGKPLGSDAIQDTSNYLGDSEVVLCFNIYKPDIDAIEHSHHGKGHSICYKFEELSGDTSIVFPETTPGVYGSLGKVSMKAKELMQIELSIKNSSKKVREIVVNRIYAYFYMGTLELLFNAAQRNWQPIEPPPNIF